MPLSFNTLKALLELRTEVSVISHPPRDSRA